MARTFPSLPVLGHDKTIVEGFVDQPYQFANYGVAGVAADVAIPVGFWRSVGDAYDGFFHECFLDEIAVKAGRDPIELRLELKGNWPTAVKVLRQVAAMANWGTKPDIGQARGVAFTLSFGTWVAQIVAVSVTPAGIRIDKVWCAADVGKAIDPDILAAQMEGGIMFGLSAAMGQEITFADGMVEQSNFHDYDAVRMHQAPPSRSSSWKTLSAWVARVSRAPRRSPRRWPTPSSRQRVSVFASCRCPKP